MRLSRNDPQLIDLVSRRLGERLAERGHALEPQVLILIARFVLNTIDRYQEDKSREQQQAGSNMLKFLSYTTNRRGEPVAEFIGDGVFQKGKRFQYNKERTQQAMERQLGRDEQQYRILEQVLASWPS